MIINYSVHGSTPDEIEERAEKVAEEFAGDRGWAIKDIDATALMLWSGEVATWEARVTAEVSG